MRDHGSFLHLFTPPDIVCEKQGEGGEGAAVREDQQVASECGVVWFDLTGCLRSQAELQGNSVDEILSVLNEVGSFVQWAESMRQLQTSNAIAAQFGGGSAAALQGR